jgi:hypothetical protein
VAGAAFIAVSLLVPLAALLFAVATPGEWEAWRVMVFAIPCGWGIGLVVAAAVGGAL